MVMGFPSLIILVVKYNTPENKNNNEESSHHYGPKSGTCTIPQGINHFPPEMEGISHTHILFTKVWPCVGQKDEDNKFPSNVQIHTFPEPIQAGTNHQGSKKSPCKNQFTIPHLPSSMTAAHPMITTVLALRRSQIPFDPAE